MSDTTTEQYLCKDCKHAFVKLDVMIFRPLDRNNPYRYSCRKSFKPDEIKPNPVTGQSKVTGRYEGCTMFRIGKSKEGNCGEDAYYWEPKHKTDLFRFIKKVAHESGS